MGGGRGEVGAVLEMKRRKKSTKSKQYKCDKKNQASLLTLSSGRVPDWMTVCLCKGLPNSSFPRYDVVWGKIYFCRQSWLTQATA